MKSSLSSIIITIVLTTLIVGSASYLIFNKSENNECFKTYQKDNISFEYPCDWGKDITNKETLGEIGTAVAPDGQASFQYPAIEIGFSFGTELVNEFNTTINNKKYPTKKFEGLGVTYLIFEMGTDVHKNGYNISYIYTNSEHEDDLKHIIETFRF
ncbi:MAG: hypothetical protein L3J07_04540 [Candidatus Magasanikbacteria bacterium]|nr:hypothetical protein [Candidatus Magasanikbacteria bacterium]